MRWHQRERKTEQSPSGAERLGTMGGATRRSNAYSKIDTETNDGEEALKDAFAHFPPLKVSSLPRFATALVLERP